MLKRRPSAKHKNVIAMLTNVYSCIFFTKHQGFAYYVKTINAVSTGQTYKNKRFLIAKLLTHCKICCFATK